MQEVKGALDQDAETEPTSPLKRQIDTMKDTLTNAAREARVSLGSAADSTIAALKSLTGDALFKAFVTPAAAAEASTELGADGLPAPLSGGVVFDKEYDSVDVHQLAKLLWSKMSPLAAEQHELAKHTAVQTPAWTVSKTDDQAIERTATMRSTAPVVGEHTITDKQVLKRIGNVYILMSASATNIKMLGAKHFITNVQTVIAATGGGRKTRLRASWVGEWEKGKKPALLASQVSGGAEKGVPQGYHLLHETLTKPAVMTKHWKKLQDISGRKSMSGWGQSGGQSLIDQLA